MVSVLNVVPARPPRGRNDGVDARRVASGCEHRLHGPRERRGAAYYGIGARRSRRIDLHEIERPRLEREIALDRHGAGGIAGREGAAVVDRGRAHRADAGERAAAVDGHGRVGDRAVHDQGAGIDTSRTGIGARPREHQLSGALLDEPTGAGDRAAEDSRIRGSGSERAAAQRDQA